MNDEMAELRAAGLMIFRLMNEQKIEYLLLQASNLNHHWTPPKGHLDPGETEIDAAKRETQEEAGLTPNDYEIIDGFNSELNYGAWGKSKKVMYWTAKVKNPLVTIKISDEHQAYQWCDLQTLLQMTDKDNMKELYRACENFLLNNYLKKN